MAIVIPYVKQTWTDGSGGGTPVSAARLGVVEEGILDVSYSPAVLVYHNTTQSITTSTDTALAFNSERFDQAGNAASTMHDTVTNNSRLTCRYAGIYQITGHCEWASNTGGVRRVWVRLNGTTKIGNGTSADSLTNDSIGPLAVTTLYSLAVNDYVEMIVWQNSGAGLNVAATANYSPAFMMVRVG